MENKFSPIRYCLLKTSVLRRWSKPAKKAIYSPKQNRSLSTPNQFISKKVYVRTRQKHLNLNPPLKETEELSEREAQFIGDNMKNSETIFQKAIELKW